MMKNNLERVTAKCGFFFFFFLSLLETSENGKIFYFHLIHLRFKYKTYHFYNSGSEM